MKSKPKAVYIKNDNDYTELTWREFETYKIQNPDYQNKKFIPVYGYLMEVTESEYKDFYKEYEHLRYIKKRDKGMKLLSLDYLYDTRSDILLWNCSDNVEEITVHKIMTEKLIYCVSVLDLDEQDLINALYFENLSERKYSKIIKIPQKTINYRKQNILNKLRKMLEN